MADQETPTTYLFDEFFAGADEEGVVIAVKIRGKNVPITIRPGLSIADRNAAEQASVKKTVKPNGQVTVSGLDESLLVEEMLLRGIIAWPFTNRDGSPVPITRENIRNLRGGATEIAQALRTIDEQGVEALAPFVPASGAA